MESFAHLRRPGEQVTVKIEAAADEDLLVPVLDEVVYQLEVHDHLPAEVTVEQQPADRMSSPAEVRFATVPAV